MNEKLYTFVLILYLGFINVASGQVITFQNIVPWITLREGNIIARTLVDTAATKGNNIKLTLSKVEQGRKVRIMTKNFKPAEYSNEYELANIEKEIVGGKDFLKVEWNVVGNDEKGVVEPFGIVKLNGESEKSALKCKKISCALEASALKSVLKEKDFIAVGNNMFCPVWNKTMLGLVCKNMKEASNISFHFDGKNGKNAFISFSDRIVTYYPGKESLSTIYYKRTVTDTGIRYDPKEWIQEIKKDAKEGLVVISIPWYDIGMLAQDGRIFGFAVFASSLKNEESALPEAAQRYIPGTWGDIILTEK